MTRRRKHDLRKLEFPDPGKKWRRLLVAVVLCLGVGIAVVGVKLTRRVENVGSQIIQGAEKTLRGAKK